jgi:hypothetical protein
MMMILFSPACSSISDDSSLPSSSAAVKNSIQNSEAGPVCGVTALVTDELLVDMPFAATVVLLYLSALFLPHAVRQLEGT